jgi:hypothetical protein
MLQILPLKDTPPIAMKHNLIILLTTAFFLSGCAAGESLKDMKQSKAIYKACLAQHPEDALVCKRQKVTYEDALQAYGSMTDGSNSLDASTSRN